MHLALQNLNTPGRFISMSHLEVTKDKDIITWTDLILDQLELKDDDDECILFIQGYYSV